MREWMFDRLIALALKHYKKVLLVSLVVTFIMMGMSSGLKMNFNWKDLLPEDMPMVKEYEKIQQEHNDYSMLIVLIRGGNREELKLAADDVASVLQERTENFQEKVKDPEKKKTAYFKDIDWKIPYDFLSNHGFMTMKPEDAKRVVKIYRDPNLPALLEHFNDDLEKTYIGGEDDLQENENEVVQSLDAIAQAMHKINQYLSEDKKDNETIDDIAKYFTYGDGYYFSLDGKIVMVLASCTPEIVEFADKYAEVAYAVEDDLKPVQEKHSGLQIEMTGMTTIGKDEMESVGTYTYVLTLVALVVIFLLLVYSFRMVSSPVLILIPLIMAIIWDLGITAIFIGYINAFTAIISIVLLGIGIDFAIHLISRYSEVRSHNKSLEDSLSAAVKNSGGGILTGGLTTAIAFLTLMIAETKGIKEFGFTAGVGILLSLVAMFLILPSLIVYRERRLEKKGKNTVPPKVEFKFLGTIGNGISKAPVIILVVFLAVTAFMFIKSRNIGWLYDFLELEPKGLRSVELYDEIIDEFGFSSSLSFTTTDSIEEARQLTKQFKKKQAIGQVESLSEIIRSDREQEDTASLLKDVRSRISSSNLRKQPVSEARQKLIAQVERLEMNLIELGDMAVIGGQDRINTKIVSILDADKMGNPTDSAVTQRLLKTLKADDDSNRFRSLVEGFFPEMKSRLIKITNPEKITEQSIPRKMLEKFKSEESKSYMINLYPKEDIFNKQSLDRFLAQVDQVKEGVTGFPQLMVEMIDATIRDGKVTIQTALFVIILLLLLDFSLKPMSMRILYVIVGVPLIILANMGYFPISYCFLIVVPLLIVDIRGMGYTLMALLPILTGLIWTVGFMALIGMPYNYMNVMALPIILGIGIDDGVHFLHRYRESKDKDIPHILTWVGKAIMLTSLTTMIGFGSVGLYTHVGMATMGIVLLAGVGFCFITTMFILAPTLSIWQRIRNGKKS